MCVELIIKPTAASETVRRTLTTPCTLDIAVEPDADDVPVGECAVKVWAARTSDLEAIFVSKTLDLEASSVNRYEREGDPATCGLQWVALRWVVGRTRRCG